MKKYDIVYSLFRIIPYLVFVIFIVFFFLLYYEFFDIKTLTTYLNSMTIFLGVAVALLTLTFNSSRSTSKEYLDKSISLLEDAYTLFTKKLTPEDWPKNDRLLWLTVARMLHTSNDLGSKIKYKSHRNIYKVTKQFWSYRFYDILKIEEDSFPATYFAEKPEHLILYNPRKDQVPLSLKSISVLYRFAKWPEELKDPLSDISTFSEEEIEKMCDFGPRGLGNHLKAVMEEKKSYET